LIGIAEMSIRDMVVEAILEAAENRGINFSADIDDSTVLLESGLDSLGYAIVVTLLDEKLDYDPFYQMDEPVYPTTLGEFVAIYERYQS